MFTGRLFGQILSVLVHGSEEHPWNTSVLYARIEGSLHLVLAFGC